MYQMIVFCIVAMMLPVASLAESLKTPGVPASLANHVSENYPSSLERLNDQFMQSFFEFQPSAATRAGFHQYDTRMESLDAARVARQIALYRRYLKRLDALDTRGWRRWELDDREMLQCFVRSRVFELETQQTWRQNPDFYSSVLSDSTFLLIGRNFAPLHVRLAALAARERQMPGLLRQAHTNLQNPPRIYTEIALEQLPGIIDFLRHDVPSAFADVKDAKLQAEFAESNAAVVAALSEYQAWLQRELLPRSHGDFRLGAKNLQMKLANEEMVDVPLDRLMQVGLENLRRNQNEFHRVAKLIDPSKTPQQLLEEIEKEHPPANELLQAFRDKLLGIREFTDAHAIITTPSRNLPALQETPAYLRATTFASMDAPGPFETKATEAFFNVTLPEQGWTPAQVEEYMAAYNWGVVTSTAIHEVIPGHYEQYLWNEHVPSRIRQFLSLDLSNIGGHFSGTNVEGWAHYTEQMMIDEGYGRTAGIPEEQDTPYLKLRLGQLQDALLRNARFVVAIRMHSGSMTIEEANAFFENEGYQTKSNAVREVKRGTSDPTYLMYTLGKLQIQKLRSDWTKRQPELPKPNVFHDLFMQQGVAPVKVIRRALLHNDSPTL
jgi:uncharacterized protein (DUF885 family)